VQQGKCLALHFCFGSKADIELPALDVRYSPKKRTLPLYADPMTDRHYRVSGGGGAKATAGSP
jgi:hypothetical protein